MQRTCASTDLMASLSNLHLTAGFMLNILLTTFAQLLVPCPDLSNFQPIKNFSYECNSTITGFSSCLRPEVTLQKGGSGYAICRVPNSVGLVRVDVDISQNMKNESFTADTHKMCQNSQIDRDIFIRKKNSHQAETFITNANGTINGTEVSCHYVPIREPSRTFPPQNATLSVSDSQQVTTTLPSPTDKTDISANITIPTTFNGTKPINWTGLLIIEVVGGVLGPVMLTLIVILIVCLLLIWIYKRKTRSFQLQYDQREKATSFQSDYSNLSLSLGTSHSFQEQELGDK